VYFNVLLLQTTHLMNLNTLEHRLGYTFKNQDLLEQSLLRPNNERLEFLGDSILHTVISEYLFRNYAQKSEGEMSIIRGALISKKHALETCVKLSLANFLGFTTTDLRDSTHKETALADTLEAIIAAIYLDGGLPAVTEFIARHVLPQNMEAFLKKDLEHPKNTLQTRVSRMYGKDPTYHVISESAAPPNRFVVKVCVGTRELAKGNGRTMAEADRRAAKNALEKIPAA
jgi:ribonuclease III